MDSSLKIQIDESDFIKACVDKEQWAQKKLYEDHYSSMVSVAMRYSNTNDDALDILHEGFIKIFKNMHKYQTGTSITAWIRRIIINTAIDFYRKDIRRRSEDLDTAYYLSTDDPDAISNMTSQEILEALQQLSISYRSVFNLYVIEGYSHREVAEILGITESTSRSNLVKARTRLKAILLAVDITER
jgi:RNA polymerase sigma-70 factor (ECF subfamily)